MSNEPKLSRAEFEAKYGTAFRPAAPAESEEDYPAREALPTVDPEEDE